MRYMPNSGASSFTRKEGKKPRTMVTTTDQNHQWCDRRLRPCRPSFAVEGDEIASGKGVLELLRASGVGRGCISKRLCQKSSRPMTRPCLASNEPDTTRMRWPSQPKIPHHDVSRDETVMTMSAVNERPFSRMTRRVPDNRRVKIHHGQYHGDADRVFAHITICQAKNTPKKHTHKQT